jgi:hypothetical protein
MLKKISSLSCPKNKFHFSTKQNPKIIFLEGEPLSNNISVVLEKLKKMGFQTYNNEFPTNELSLEEFNKKLKHQLDDERQQNRKDGFVFLNGSPLSLLLSKKNFQEMETKIVNYSKELKKEFNSIHLQSICEDYMMKMRIGYHYEIKMEQPFNVEEEVNFLHQMNQEHGGKFDDFLHTTDSKQCVYLILQKFNIQFPELK